MSYFKTQMHQNRFILRLTALPRRPSWIYGAIILRERRGSPPPQKKKKFFSGAATVWVRNIWEFGFPWVVDEVQAADTGQDILCLVQITTKQLFLFITVSDASIWAYVFFLGGGFSF